MTEWLDDSQQRDWRSFIEGAIRLIDHLDQGLRASHAVSLAEYEILVRLSEAPQQRMRMAELAAVSYYSRSRLSHSISRLQARALVARGEASDDKRGVVALLTEQGMAAITAAAPDNLKLVRDVFIDAIDPADLQAIGRAMRAMIAQLPPPTRRAFLAAQR